jgi:hypothetical protein
MATKTETPATITEPNKTQTCKVPTQKAQLSASASACEQNSEQCPEQVCCEKIRERAYYKWEQAGYPEGDGANFWLEAEAELQAETAE